MHPATAMTVLTELWNEMTEELHRTARVVAELRPTPFEAARREALAREVTLENQVSALAFALDHIRSVSCRCEPRVDGKRAVEAAGHGGALPFVEGEG